MIDIPSITAAISGLSSGKKGDPPTLLFRYPLVSVLFSPQTDLHTSERT